VKAGLQNGERDWLCWRGVTRSDDGYFGWGRQRTGWGKAAVGCRSTRGGRWLCRWRWEIEDWGLEKWGHECHEGHEWELEGAFSDWILGLDKMRGAA